MKIAILSVPHTGTHFVFGLFGGKGLVDIGDTHLTPTDTLVSMHLHNPSVFEYVHQEGFTIAVPMRHPMTTLRSWMQWEWSYKNNPENIEEARKECKDNGDVSLQVTLPFEEALEAINPTKVFMHLNNLIEYHNLYEINFFPIDSPNRQDFINKFNLKYNRSLSTEWRPVNSIGKHEVSVPKELSEQMKDFMQDNKYFFNQFKYS